MTSTPACRAATTLRMRSGQTFAMAGLLVQHGVVPAAAAIVIEHADGNDIVLAGQHVLSRDCIPPRLGEAARVLRRERTRAPELDAVEVRFVGVVDLLDMELERLVLPAARNRHQAAVPGEAVVRRQVLAYDRQAVTGLGTAEYETKQAYAGFFPNVSFSSGASLSSSERFDQTTGIWVTGQSESFNAGLSASMDLFSGGRNLAAVRSARAGVLAAEASLVTRRFAAALEAKQAYFAVLRAEELIGLNQERIAQAQGQLTAAERQLQAGRATRSDVLRARLQMSNARQGLLSAAAQLRTSMYALGRVVGEAGPVAAARTEALAPRPLALTMAEMREIVAREAPGVVSTEANLGVAEAQLSQARAQWFPSVGVSGGYNWSNPDFTLDEGRTSWNTRINLSYPLFNGLAREAGVERARGQLLVAEAQAALQPKPVSMERTSLTSASS